MYIPNVVLVAWKCSSIYIFWITLHYTSAHIYPILCADLSLYGVISSPFLVMSPHCQGIIWIQQTSTQAIKNMWLVLGSWLCAQLLPNPEIIGYLTKQTQTDNNR